jgi:hypothetical protein
LIAACTAFGRDPDLERARGLIDEAVERAEHGDRETLLFILANQIEVALAADKRDRAVADGSAVRSKNSV